MKLAEKETNGQSLLEVPQPIPLEECQALHTRRAGLKSLLLMHHVLVTWGLDVGMWGVMRSLLPLQAGVHQKGQGSESHLLGQTCLALMLRLC